MTGTAFDHRDTGTPEADWSPDRLHALPRVAMPTPDDHLVVVAAHPDDETLGAGGLVHQARRCGARVTVVVLTDGEGSHPTSPTHDPARLAARRRDELAAAVAALGEGVALRRLGLPDGGLDALEPALVAAVAELSASATVVVTPWAGDRHPDHAAAARAGARVAAGLGVPHWSYPVWMWHWGRPDHPDVPWARLRVLPLSASDLAAKSRALRAHVSQVEPLSDAPGDEPVLGPDTLAHFLRRVETFVVDEPATARAPGGDAPAPATRPAYFEGLYAESPDPWGLETRFYERRKRELLLAALPRPRFRRAFEPGCATGLLTARLATRCDELVAWDVADAAVERTRARLRDEGALDHVTVARGAIPGRWPTGRFDLVVLSEVGYYSPSLDVLADVVAASLTDDGLVVACHWRHPAPDHPHRGDAVHEALGRRLLPEVSHVEEDFLLHVWGRDPGAVRSVARREGIVG